MSLAFLAKKGWHTTNLNNVEKVWAAEEKQKAEERKLEAYRKEIEEQRQKAELNQLQIEMGHKFVLLTLAAPCRESVVTRNRAC